jgi:hypothetical protein
MFAVLKKFQIPPTKNPQISISKTGHAIAAIALRRFHLKFDA